VVEAMSQRDGYGPGVPCWVDTWQPDLDAAVAFYGRLFGWEAEETRPPEDAGRYAVCRLHGREVAGIGTVAVEGAPPGAAWGHTVQVDDAGEAARHATAAGGSVVTPPLQSFDGGRTAVLADPSGAVLTVWQPGSHRGARLVNEPGAWAMSMLSTPDPATATPFYGELFGWETENFAFGEADITLWRLPGYEGGEPSQPVPADVVAAMIPAAVGEPAQWSVNFWVADTEAAASSAAELGGAVVAEPFDTPVSRDAVLADPQGAVFSVSQIRRAQGA
jgi:predicted enzyme related to lactoylglutathione lyase